MPKLEQEGKSIKNVFVDAKRGSYKLILRNQVMLFAHNILGHAYKSPEILLGL